MTEDYKAIWRSVRDIFPKEGMKLGRYFWEQLESGHINFTLARYHAMARMIENNPKPTVLELGCNEGVASLNLARVSEKYVGVDFDDEGIKWAQEHLQPKLDNVKFVHGDFLGKNYGTFDAVVSMDVIEHIPKELEIKMLKTVWNNLNDTGIAIIGTPNDTASKYASKTSQQGHINLYDAERLKSLLKKGFHNVIIMGMNDNVLHLGFKPMCHYLIALCAHKKDEVEE